MKTILLSATLLLFLSADAQILKDTSFVVPIYNIQMRIAVAQNIPILFEGTPDQICALTYIEDDIVHMVFEYSRIESDVIFHEVVHAVNFICISRGIGHDPENDEPQAYLAGYIGKNLITFFRQ